ncbi:hypothetical protein CHU95_08200 [Niveispirillum lacus]|uniref:Uncharacterized protein n=1 Tax=Niveispirillum lacus TaxID=1981099 RepID=A0A255Z2T5_9PROT|nr:hypothetical protein CHU95_08200 [Niveispirillum lacus]
MDMRNMPILLMFRLPIWQRRVIPVTLLIGRAWEWAGRESTPGRLLPFLGHSLSRVDRCLTRPALPLTTSPLLPA